MGLSIVSEVEAQGILTLLNFSGQIRLTPPQNPRKRINGALWPFAHCHYNASIDAPLVRLLRDVRDEAFILRSCQQFILV